MRLANFILENIEAILVEWEAFARGIWPGAATSPEELRDHAADILRATACDMKSSQTATQQTDKSQGEGDDGATADRVDGASDAHAAGRVTSGFNLVALVAEYRALRATVIRLWRQSVPPSDPSDLEDLTRFNEAIDQSLTEAVRGYTERVERSRKMFLAILGHDLRNPLNSVMLSTQMLARTRHLDTESAELVSQISTSSAAMASMINDLLDFTTVGLGDSMRISKAPMDLHALCREVLEESQAANPSRAFQYHHEGDLRGDWDAGRLRQVISNLLGNAVQHGSGVITLSVVGEEPKVRLSVQNRGSPIPKQLLPTIFDPLVRGSPPVSEARRRPGSLGLGLHISKEAVTAHGGTIDVTSSPEEGTVFTVHLPRRPIVSK